MALSRMLGKFLPDARAQAAITDALYFLTIVAALCLFLFIFATQYGATVGQSIKDRYLEEYEASALKTILYSSTPRDPSQTLDNSREIDFLLAAVKEDFADDSALDETKVTLLDNIRLIMNSKSDSFDYIFYIYSSQSADPFPFFVYYKSQWPEGTSVPHVVGGRVIECTNTTDPNDPGYCGHKFYFCDPEKLSDIDNLLIGVSGVPPTRNRIKLVKLEPVTVAGSTSYRATPFTAEAFLKMWSSTTVNADAFLKLRCCDAGTPNCPFAPQPTPPAAPATP